MKAIYLGAYEAYHPEFDIVYQDINGKRDLGGDMMDIDLIPYDFIIATPPCNFWSIARGNRCSQYSLDTKHLLPDIITKLSKTGKFYVVENVVNKKRFREEGVFEIAEEANCFVYYIGRHTYFTNIELTQIEVKTLAEQNRQDFKYHGQVIKYDDMQNKKHQGGYNVHLVIDYFLKKIKGEKMSKVYIVKAPQGSYEDYREPIVKVYLDKNKAEQYIKEKNSKLPLEQAEKCEGCVYVGL